jgi:hypothetical protein
MPDFAHGRPASTLSRSSSVASAQRASCQTGCHFPASWVYPAVTTACRTGGGTAGSITASSAAA